MSGDEKKTQNRAEELRKLRETAQRMESEARKQRNGQQANIVFSPPAQSPTKK